MNCGIIYAIAGDQEIKKILMSINALKMVSSVPFKIFAHLSDKGYKKLNDHDVIKLEHPPEICKNDMKKISRFMKTSVQRVTPFDYTMYMDNDMVTVRDPTWIFSLIPYSGIVFGRDAGKTINDYSGYATPKRSLPKEIKKNFDVDVDPNWLIWNGGLFVFNKKGAKFLDCWHKNQMKNIAGIPGWSQRDQGTLIATIWQNKMQTNPILPSTANFLHGLHSGLRLRKGKWITKHKDNVITNLHLCLSWGKEDSKTWRQLSEVFNKPVPLPGKPIIKKAYEEQIKPKKKKKHTLVIPYGAFDLGKRFASPFLHILRALEECENDDVQVIKTADIGNPLKQIGDYIEAVNPYSAIVMFDEKIIMLEYKDHVNPKNCRIGNIVRRSEEIGMVVDLVLKHQFRPKTYDKLPVKVLPYMYVTVNTHEKGINYHHALKKEVMKNQQNFDFDDVLFTRWAHQKPRRHINEKAQEIKGADVQFASLNRGKHQQEDTRRNRLSGEVFFKKMTRSMFILDAPGNGDVTHRALEAHLIGVPVIRPKMKNTFYHPYEAGEHYIECHSDGDDLKAIVEFYKKPENYKKALQIAKNAMEYCDKYCTRKGLANLFLEIMKDEGIYT